MAKEKTQGRAKALITEWHPEEQSFWENGGRKIANKNLTISIICLLLSFCVWMLFSTVAISLNKIGFHFTTSELFMLTALPAASGAIMRVPFSFVVPIFGGRLWTTLCTAFLAIPALWLGIAVNDPTTPYSTFVLISLLCGVAGGNFASSMANISFFYPKKQQGTSLGLNGGLGNLGVSVMQLFAPLVITIGIFGESGSTLLDGSTIYVLNAAFMWVPLVLIAAVLAWFGMNDLTVAKSSLKEQLPILKRPHMWILSTQYFWTFGSFIGFCAGFAVLTKTQFPKVDIIEYAFLGPLIGSLMRPIGGVLADKYTGIRVTALNFVAMFAFCGVVLMALPSGTSEGDFPLFFTAFMLLFATAGLGSGSAYQMIAVTFRKISVERALAMKHNPEQAEDEAIKSTAAALGFISAIGAAGGFFVPKSFGTAIALTGSPVAALALFMAFYVVCILIAVGIYGRREAKLRVQNA